MQWIRKNGKKYRQDGDFLIVEDESHVIYREMMYTLDGQYYRCQDHESYSKGLLHRAVWIKHFGTIPKGHHIHHRDANRRNNHPENLQCLEERIHLSRSARKDFMMEITLEEILLEEGADSIEELFEKYGIESELLNQKRTCK